MKVIITTDGSVSKNGKQDAYGGIGMILQSFKNDKIVKEKEIGEKLPEMLDGCPITNNRAEMYAILKGLEEITGKNCTIEVHSDSELCIKTLNGEYSRKTNTDLWERLDKRCEELKNRGCSIMFIWVRGHSDNEVNIRADKLAGKAKRGDKLASKAKRGV